MFFSSGALAESGPWMEAQDPPGEVPFLIADGSTYNRRILSAAISSHPGWTVVAEAEDGKGAVDLAVKHKPSVVLIDLSTTKQNGITATQRVKALLPTARVIVYTDYHSETFRQLALGNGADAFFWKEDLDLPLLEALVSQWFS